MIRTTLLLAVTLLGLGACRDDNDDIITPTPTPSPLVTPTPIPGTDDEDLNDGDTTDGSDVIDEEEDSTINGDGALMAAPNEAVGVISLDSTTVIGSLLTVQRTNGEIWEFQLLSIPTSRIGTTLIYRNRGLVFGSIEGIIIFDDGVAMSIESSARIQ